MSRLDKAETASRYPVLAGLTLSCARPFAELALFLSSYESLLVTQNKEFHCHIFLPIQCTLLILCLSVSVCLFLSLYLSPQPSCQKAELNSAFSESSRKFVLPGVSVRTQESRTLESPALRDVGSAQSRYRSTHTHIYTCTHTKS